MRVLLAGLTAAGALCATGDAAAQASDRSLTPFEVARTQRLLGSRLACVGCHRIEGRGGQIGPPLDGLADRAEPDYVRRVILDPAGTVPATMMPFQAVPAQDVDRLVSYLLTLPAEPVTANSSAIVPEPPPPLEESERGDGAALYARHCAACHGEEGSGDGWNAPNLPVAPTAHADPRLMGARPDDTLFDAIFAGAYVLDGSPSMPPFGNMLSPEQIRALVSQIRVLCSCSQPGWAGSG